MSSRPRLIALGLFCLLAAAADVSSQDVTGSAGYYLPMDGYYSPRFHESFRDGCFRTVRLEPIINGPANVNFAPVDYQRGQVDRPIELLPPVEEPQAAAAGDFEQIQVPQPAAILDPNILEPAAKAKENSEEKKIEQPPKIWSGNVELGLNGTEGNSQTFNFHSGFDLKRKTKSSVFTSNLDYNKTNSDSVNTVNRLFQETRLERMHSKTPWTWYAHESADYDEFQPWNVQINADTGIGYQLIETEATDLTGRFGGGFSHEIGGLDDAYVPELLFGTEFERRVNERHKYKLSVEYFPDVTDFSEFRMVDKAAWEILLDKDHNLSISLNATDTINRPNPGGRESDLDYSAVLLWNF